MIRPEDAEIALFKYLEDESSLSIAPHLLSRREFLRDAYHALSPDNMVIFQQDLVRCIGDPARSLHDRTRLIELVPLVQPDRRVRRLARRQIVDDVRRLFSQHIPSGGEGPHYVKRLRCLLELGIHEPAAFWKTAYQLCGSCCGFVVFTALYDMDDQDALKWLETYLSAHEQVRVLEKVLPTIRATHDSVIVADVERHLAHAEESANRARPDVHDWESILLSVVSGGLHVEVAHSGTLEFLRDQASQGVHPDIEASEMHLNAAVDRLFARWTRGQLELDVASSLRLVALAREFPSIEVLSALIHWIDSGKSASAVDVVNPGTISIGSLVLDSLQWFDSTFDYMDRAREDGAEEPAPGVARSLVGVLAAVRGRPEWADRAERELVRHCPSEEERAQALLAMLSHQQTPLEWIEDLDRRMGRGRFQALAQFTFRQYRMYPHLQERLSALASWCDETYTNRDALAPGTGWIIQLLEPPPFQDIAIFRDREDVRACIDALADSVDPGETER